MKTRTVLSVLLCVGGLLFLSACSSDDNGQVVVLTATPTVKATATATVAPTTVPTHTPTSQPTSTATSVPSATATTPPTSTATAEATATATEEATATPTVTSEPTTTPTEPVSQGLGTHVFTIFRQGSCGLLGDNNSCFFTSAVSFEVGSDPWLPGPIHLVGGEPDENGVAQVTLAEDVIIGFQQPLAAQCFKLIKEGTTGRIDCDGGTPNDVTLTLNSNEGEPATFPPTVATDLGEDGGAGALTLLVQFASAQTTTVADCATAEFGQATTTPFTTGIGTSIVENPRQGFLEPFSATGINISCATWASGGGTAGRLIVPLSSEDIPVLNIDAGAILQLQEE